MKKSYCNDLIKKTFISLTILGLVMLLSCVGLAAEKCFNDYTLEIIKNYSVDGSFPYAWTSERGYYGITKDLYYLGELFIKGDSAKRSYCSGITFEVFMQAYQAYNEDYGRSKIGNINNIDELEYFRRMWYGADGNKTTIKHAIESSNLGYEIEDLDQVKKGDFVQIWRHSGSGHTVVFIDWLKDENGEKIGFKYWSSNYKTGISYRSEYFGDDGSKMIKDQTYFMRITPNKVRISKVLRINQNEVEFKGIGKYELAADVKLFLLKNNQLIEKPFSALRLGKVDGKVRLDNKGKVKEVLLFKEQSYDNIRVIVSSALSPWGSSISRDFSQIYLKSVGNYNVFRYNNIYKEDILRLKKNDEIILVPLHKGIGVITDWTFHTIEDDRLFISAENDKSKMEVESTTRHNLIPTYAGSFEVIPSNEEGNLYLINDLALPNYLYKVVPSEMPLSFGLEAYKTQAVVARSYAVSQMNGNRYGAFSADVDDSTSCQVYNNCGDIPLAVEAVNVTRGIVPTYNDEVISAYFYSTSGGYSANVEDVWHSSEGFPGTPVPYLKAKPQIDEFEGINFNDEAEVLEFYKTTNWENAYDKSSSWFRWNVTLTREELEATISKNLPAREKADKILGVDMIQTIEGMDASEPNFSIGTLENIKVIRRGSGTNIMILEIKGSNGVWHVKKEYNIRFAIRPRKDMCNSERDIIINRFDGSTYKNYSILPSAFFSFEINRENNQILDITFYGGGNGHGVGMSQCGVKGMASKGYSFEDILNHYYTDLEFKNIY